MQQKNQSPDFFQVSNVCFWRITRGRARLRKTSSFLCNPTTSVPLCLYYLDLCPSSALAPQTVVNRSTASFWKKAFTNLEKNILKIIHWVLPTIRNYSIPPGKDRWLATPMYYMYCWFIMAPYFSPPFGSGASRHRSFHYGVIENTFSDDSLCIVPRNHRFL